MAEQNVRPNVEIMAGPGVDSKDRSTWEYVSVPESDIFDKPHQGAAINSHRFTRGKTYFMPPLFAAELKEILAKMQKADIRIMQSSPSREAVRDANKGGNGGASTFIPS